MAYEIRKILIVFIIASVVSYGLFALYAETANTYEFTIDERFNHSFYKINETYSIVTNVQEEVLNGTISGSDAEGSIFVRSIQGMRTLAKGTGTIISLPSLFYTVTSDVASFLRIPEFVVYALYVILGIIITLTIMSALLRNPL